MTLYQYLGSRGYWKTTIQEYGTRHIPTLRKDYPPKYSFPQYSTERPKPSGQTLSLHNSRQTTAASTPTSIKGQRRPHHYVAAQKWKNKQLFTSWKTAAYSTKASSPLCGCPEMEEQRALHLLKDCSPFNEVRPAAFQTLTIPQIMQHHINTKAVSSLINDIYHMLQQQSLSDQP